MKIIFIHYTVYEIEFFSYMTDITIMILLLDYENPNCASHLVLASWSLKTPRLCKLFRDTRNSGSPPLFESTWQSDKDEGLVTFYANSDNSFYSFLCHFISIHLGKYLPSFTFLTQVKMKHHGYYTCDMNLNNSNQSQ